MPTEVIKTVGPGKDYASLAAWVAGQAGDMRAGSGSDTIQIAELYSFTDTTPVVISGFIGDATHYALIRTVSTERFQTASWDSAKYVLKPATSLSFPAAIRINDRFVRIEGLQIDIDLASTISGAAIVVATNNLDSDVRIRNCLIQNNYGLGATSGNGINITTPVTLQVVNCAIYNCWSGIAATAASTSLILNCTLASNGSRGIVTGGTVDSNFRIVNCYAGDNPTGDYSLTSSPEVTYSASSDSTGSEGLRSIPFDTNNFANVTSGSEDFTLQSTSVLRSRGTLYQESISDIVGVFRAIFDIGCSEFPDTVDGVIFYRTISQTPRKQALIDKEDYWVPPQLYLEQEEPFFPARTTPYTTTARFTDLWDDPTEVVLAYFYLDPDEPFFPAHTTLYATTPRFTDLYDPDESVFFYLDPDEPFFPAVTNIPPTRWFTTLPDPDERVDLAPDFWLIDDDAYIAQSVTYTTYKRFTPGLPDDSFRFILIESQDDYRPRATAFPTYTYLRQGAGWSEDETNFYVHLIDYDQPLSLQRGQATTRFDVYARFQLSNEPEQLDFIYWDRDDAAPIAATRFTTYRFIPPIDDEVRAFSTLINDEDHQRPLAHAVASFPRNTPSPFFHQDVFQFIYIGQIDNDPFVARATAIPQPRIPLPIDDENLQRAPLEEFFVYTAATLVAPTYARYILPDVESPILSLEENELLTLSRPFPYTPSVVLRFHDSDQPGLLWLYEEDNAWARPSPFSFQRITTARLATFQYETEVHGLGFIYPGYDEITGRARLVPLLTGHTQLTLLLTGSLRLLPTITGRLTMIEDTLPLGCDVDIEWHDAEFSSDDEPLTDAMSVTATAYITNTSDALVAGSTVTPTYDPVVGCWRATFPGTINLTEGEWYYCVMQLVVTAPASRVARGKRSLRRQALRLG